MRVELRWVAPPPILLQVARSAFHNAQGYNNCAIAKKLVLGVKSVEMIFQHDLSRELTFSHNGPLHPRVQAVLSYVGDIT